jgi:hypothetical protein
MSCHCPDNIIINDSWIAIEFISILILETHLSVDFFESHQSSSR